MEEPPKEIIEKLKSMTKHENAMLMERGNAAIFAALCSAHNICTKTAVLIPDQGGWTSFRNYPKMFGMKTIDVKTDYGIIDLKDLKNKSKDCAAFLFTSFAGYFAEQPIKKISSICKDNNCLLIEDASGALGYPKLCNGKYSDIIVGSFSGGSSVNVGYGGFMTALKPEYIDAAKDVFSITKLHPAFYAQLMKKLNSSRLKMLLALTNKVKKELKAYELIHGKSDGLNVVAKYNPELIKYCMMNRYPYILCPSYIRVNEKAISIELKALSDKELMRRV